MLFFLLSLQMDFNNLNMLTAIAIPSYKVEGYFVLFWGILNSMCFSFQLLSQDCYLHRLRSLQDLVHHR